MELMCPHCHQHNLVDAGSAASLTSFVCASCATEFDAVLVDDALIPVLPRDVCPAAPFPPAAPSPFAATPAGLPDQADDLLDILNIPQDTFDAAPAEARQSQVLEDLFASAPAASRAGEELPAAGAQSKAAGAELPSTAGTAASVSANDAVDPNHVTESGGERAAAAAARVAQSEEQAAAPAAPAVKPAPATVKSKSAAAGAAPAPHAPAYDKYAVGMRVLRISPAWLLLSSVGFFAVLLTLSWMSQPVGPVSEAVAAAGARLPNQATSPAPKADAPGAAVEAAKSAAEGALPPAPKAAAKPAAEANKPAPPQVSQSFSEAAGSGNYTVQVGSYNDLSEANQRVSQLRSAGFESRAVAVELPKRGTWYRVQAGRFETREEAAKAGAQMRAKGAASAAIVTEVGEKQ